MKNILLGLLIIGACASFAQTNLIPNPTFQEVDKKVKDQGQIELALPWTSATLTPADLYVIKTKSELVGIPDNAHGEEKPMSGDNYAGIVAYGYKGKIPRTYLQAKLTQKLEAGEKYCVTIHVSLSDLSKYACNYLGAYISRGAVSAKNNNVLQFDPQIVSQVLKVYDKQFYWTPICGVYEAKGGEEYITIGNFTLDDSLELKKVKRPRGLTMPQKYDSYYYIDNVSMTPLEQAGECECDGLSGKEKVATVTRSFISDEKDNSSGKVTIIDSEGSPSDSATKSPKKEIVGVGETKTLPSKKISESIDGMVIKFTPKSFSIVGSATKSMDQIVQFMKSNKTAKITLTGYIDTSEKVIAKLDGRRVSSVYKYILSKGIEKERVARKMGSDQNPIDKANKIKNMRVEVSLDK